jgi:hypothetical protein
MHVPSKPSPNVDCFLLPLPLVTLPLVIPSFSSSHAMRASSKRSSRDWSALILFKGLRLGRLDVSSDPKLARDVCFFVESRVVVAIL